MLGRVPCIAQQNCLKQELDLQALTGCTSHSKTRNRRVLASRPNPEHSGDTVHARPFVGVLQKSNSKSVR